MKETSHTRALLLSAAVALLMSATVAADSDSIRTLTAGSTWTIAQSTKLNRLTIPDGATITAADGKNLTMTVDGVGTTIRPGIYIGDIALTITNDILVKYGELDAHRFRAAVYVNDGKYMPAQSVAAAVASGTVNDSAASNVAIASNEAGFNGIFINGHSKYSINNPTISLTGNGGNDFAGYGAAIMSSGTADVTVDKAIIRTKGAVRTAVFVGGDSTMHVNNSTIETLNGVLPGDYKFNIDLGKMMEVPWMLGLSGNVRSTNVVANGTVYYTNTHLKSQAWGVLSTDDTKHVRMFVKNSTIETVDSGYGAYSIGNTVDTFSHSTFNVADIGVIMAAEGSATFTDGTIVNSRRFGVMMHSGGGGGTLTIDKGSVFNTKSTAILVKGRGVNISVDNAKLNAANGIILQAMLNDDPFAMGPGGPPPGAGGPPAGGAPPAGPPGGAPQGPAATTANGPLGPDVIASFKNVALNGDFINSRTAQGDLKLSFANARINGAISIASQAPASGAAPNADTYKLIGDVVNTLGPSSNSNGLQLSLGKASTWTVTRTSYLSSLTLASGAKLSAPKGSTLSLLINGVATPIKAGSYSGNVVVQVSAI
jgi:hypothetical protein